MKASKFLISAISTAAVVSAIGFSNAQTDNGPGGTAPGSASVPKSVNETPGPKGMQGNTSNTQRNTSNSASGMSSGASSSSAPATSSTDSSMANERVARVDRN